MDTLILWEEENEKGYASSKMEQNYPEWSKNGNPIKNRRITSLLELYLGSLDKIIKLSAIN
jgi:hypothetical protein